MLLDEGIDMAHTFLLEDFLDSDKYARLLHIAEAIINSCAEELHCG